MVVSVSCATFLGWHIFADWRGTAHTHYTVLTRGARPLCTRASPSTRRRAKPVAGSNNVVARTPLRLQIAGWTRHRKLMIVRADPLFILQTRDHHRLPSLDPIIIRNKPRTYFACRLRFFGSRSLAHGQKVNIYNSKEDIKKAHLDII